MWVARILTLVMPIIENSFAADNGDGSKQNDEF